MALLRGTGGSRGSRWHPTTPPPGHRALLQPSSVGVKPRPPHPCPASGRGGGAALARVPFGTPLPCPHHPRCAPATSTVKAMGSRVHPGQGPPGDPPCRGDKAWRVPERGGGSTLPPRRDTGLRRWASGRCGDARGRCSRTRGRHGRGHPPCPRHRGGAGGDRSLYPHPAHPARASPGCSHRRRCPHGDGGRRPLGALWF